MGKEDFWKKILGPQLGLEVQWWDWFIPPRRRRGVIVGVYNFVDNYYWISVKTPKGEIPVHVPWSKVKIIGPK